MLVPLSAVNMSYAFTAEEKREVFKDVVVRVVVEADGRVATAKAIAGPPRLFARAEATAMMWRFEPLAPHGLKAPLAWTITFKPLGA
jgi:outer membrane biosynthesis protein TonB